MIRVVVALVCAAGLSFVGCGSESEYSVPAEGVSGGASISKEELEGRSLSHGQLVYVPVYSHITYRDADKPYAFAANVSIRNTDRKNPIAVTSARYYDNDGKLLREYLETPRVLEPLGTTTVVVLQSDMTGGMGANFLVEWGAEQAVSEPVIEAVMVGQQEVRAAAFRSPGHVIEELGGK